MKTIRTLAAAALTTFGLAAGFAPAQSNLPGSGIPRLVSETQKNLGHEALGKALKPNTLFEVTELVEKGSAPCFSVKHSYNPKLTKDNYDWTLQVQVVEKSSLAPMARIWFNCQLLPKDVDAGRLRAMMTWNGGHGDSRGYFSLAKVKDGEMLSLIVDVPAADVTEKGMQTAIFDLYQMAWDTSGLWGGKLNEPLAKVEKKTDKTALADESLLGMWKGKLILDGENVGECSAKFEKGWVTMSRVNTTVNEPKLQILTGSYEIEGSRLKCSFIDGNKSKEPLVEEYEIELDGKNLTLIQGVKSVLKIELKKSK